MERVVLQLPSKFSIWMFYPIIFLTMHSCGFHFSWRVAKGRSLVYSSIRNVTLCSPNLPNWTSTKRSSPSLIWEKLFIFNHFESLTVIIGKNQVLVIYCWPILFLHFNNIKKKNNHYFHLWLIWVDIQAPSISNDRIPVRKTISYARDEG